MSNGIGVPALRQHGNRNDAANTFTEAAHLSDRIHHLAKQVLIRQLVRGCRVAGPFDQLALELLDLRIGQFAKVGIESVAGFQLLAVNEQRVRARKPVSELIVIAEQLEVPFVHEMPFIVFISSPLPAGNPFVHKLRGGGVVADDDEDGRNVDRGFLPFLVGRFVMAVESVKGCLKLVG